MLRIKSCSNSRSKLEGSALLAALTLERSTTDEGCAVLLSVSTVNEAKRDFTPWAMTVKTKLAMKTTPKSKTPS